MDFSLDYYGFKWDKIVPMFETFTGWSQPKRHITKYHITYRLEWFGWEMDIITEISHSKWKKRR